jgi:hypothetical protein
MTKLQLLQQTKYSVCDLNEGTIEDRLILTDVDSVRELKDNLQYLANKFYCLKKQEGKPYKMYLGQHYTTTDAKVDRILASVHGIAKRCGYEVYSPNGSWFVQPLTKQSKIK